GYGAADHLLASAQYRALAAGDGESVPDAEGGSRVTRIAVVGGGAWGTALADLLARKGDFDTVTLWAREPEVVESVNREHVNHMFLPGAALAPAVAAVGDLTAAVRGAEGARHRPAGAASVLDRVLQSVLCDGRAWGGARGGAQERHCPRGRHPGRTRYGPQHARGPDHAWAGRDHAVGRGVGRRAGHV